MPFGDRLKALRKEKRMTLEDVAKRLGVGRATVRKYENGMITNIPSDKIEIIANIFGVSPAYLMGWTDDPAMFSATNPSFIEDSDTLRKILMNLPPNDYTMVWEAIDRTYRAMKERGELD